MKWVAESCIRVTGFNYRYPARGRKLDGASKKDKASSFVRFNYRYPARGRKQIFFSSYSPSVIYRFNYRYPARGRKHDIIIFMYNPVFMI